MIAFSSPFGLPLPAVPVERLLAAVVSGRLAGAVLAGVRQELDRRGVPAPEALDPPIPRPCPRCPGGGFRYSWQECRDGSRRVRVECTDCRRFLAFTPARGAHAEMADLVQSRTDLLDVLLLMEEHRVKLVSDGRAVRPRPPFQFRHLPPGLARAIRGCSYRLARLLGKGVTT